MILSPAATGNGAFIIHKQLSRKIKNYQVVPYSPKQTLFPPLLYLLGRRKNAEIIHTTPDYAIFHAHHNVPLIITFHNYVLDKEFFKYGNWLQRIHWQSDLKVFHKIAVKRAKLITAVSNFTAGLAKQDLGINKTIKVIYNGIDEKVFVPGKNKKAKKEIRVFFGGNLSRRKGVNLLPKIVNKLNKDIVVFYTSGLRGGSNLVNHPRLRPLGNVPHDKMPELYRSMDILLFPSIREGFGLVVAEAMACCLPVVATDASSIPELIDHEKGGYLCPLGDVEAFSDSLNRLAEDAFLRKVMGEYNRIRVEEQFTLDKMVDAYKALFFLVRSAQH